MADSSKVDIRHFKLLQIFGRDKIAQESDEDVRKHLWKMMCRGSNIPEVPHEDAIAAWQELVSGDSSHGGLVANGDIDPRFTTVGVTFKKKIVATHTMPTDALIFKLLMIYSKAFNTPAEFETAMVHIARKAAERARGSK